ncbi:cdc42 effector protein 4 [Sardina pilchardus]|uniref:cdc42 effector protein 4 n=1 Tax=Sardina pilchardus TaxID=27697 RepID=UPI002E158A65
MPILKQLVSGSSQSKRRSRADLTPEMISAPLGDFRHTMHVGRGGDTFGDTSFLASRSGEPPRPDPQYHPHHHHASSTLQQPPQHQPPPPPLPDSPVHKPGLLSRTFRSSKRSQSVNRADKHKTASASSITVASMAPGGGGGGSPAHVKTAISMPYLNEAGGGVAMSKSASSSPLKKIGADGDAVDGWKPANGAAATGGGGVTLASHEPDLLESERRFGELSDLPPSLPRGGGGFGGMKHAESIMSFHIDLGPSMLGDILSVMDKPGWEEDDLGYEEGRPSSPLSPPEDSGDHDNGDRDNDDDDDDDAPSPPPPSRPPRSTSTAPYTPELRNNNNNIAGVTRPSNHLHHTDSCSVSSSGSTVQEDKMSAHGGQYHHHSSHRHGNQSETDGDSARYSSPGRTRDEEDRDFSFMDDEEDEDEIRV